MRGIGTTLLRGSAIALAAYSQAGLAQTTPAPAAEDEIVVYGRSVSPSTLDIPQTVNVLSESLIEETASARLGDALRRTEERRVGKEWFGTGRDRGAAYH